MTFFHAFSVCAPEESFELQELKMPEYMKEEPLSDDEGDSDSDAKRNTTLPFEKSGSNKSDLL